MGHYMGTDGASKENGLCYCLSESLTVALLMGSREGISRLAAQAETDYESAFLG